jgi:hypothetical protein
MPPDISLSPIGYLATPFRDRFGIPRQPRLAPHARGQLRLLRPYDREEAVRGLEAFRMSGSVLSSTTAAGDGIRRFDRRDWAAIDALAYSPAAVLFARTLWDCRWSNCCPSIRVPVSY